MGSTAGAKEHEFPCIDGWRAVGALAVFGYHIYVLYARDTFGYPDWAIVPWINASGFFALSMFFTISAFVLYRPFVRAHFSDRPSPAAVPFWRRRALRVFPAYWVALTGYILIIGPLNSFSQYFTAYSLIGIYRGQWQKIGLNVSWTLAIELTFYLFLPLFVWLVRSVTRTADVRSRLRAQLWMLGGLYVVGLATRAWKVQLFDSPDPTPGQWFPLKQLDFWILGNLDWFVLGMLLAVGSAWLAEGGSIPRIVSLLGRRPWLACLAALGAYILSMQVFAETPAQAVELPSMLVNTFAGLCVALLVLPAVFGDQRAGLLRWILRTRPLVFLSTVSYGFYLWQVTILYQVLEWRLDGSLPTKSFVFAFALAFVLSVAVATVSYYVLERPLLQWTRKLERRPRAPVPAAPAP